MLVVISPAKKLSVEGKKPDWITEPQFVEHSEKLIKELRKYSPKKLQKLMSISDDLAQLNVERYQQWTTNHDAENTKQALFTFTGEVYSGLNATSFKKNELEYAQQHLRILSGLYGVLKPMDAIHAYRLEMGTKLKIGKKSNLYEFWGDTIVNEINNTLKANDDKVLVNLASNEYFKAINKKKLTAPIITPVFKDFTNGQYKTVMVYAKKARGAMAAFIMKNKIKTIEELTAFDTDGYLFSEKASSPKELVFLRN